MKTKLLILLFLASFSNYAQTNLVPNGDFETWTSYSQPENWSRYFSGWTSESNSTQHGSSSTNMMIADGTFNFINSKYFPLAAGKTYRVTLYHKLVKGSFTDIKLSLYHKPSVFKEEIATAKKTDLTFSNSQWRKIEFDYTPSVSEDIEVDIWTNGTLNSEILVDNVSVVDITQTLGTEDSVFDKVAIYPNPTQGELHINNIVLEKGTVYDALGKLVKTATFTSGAKDNTVHLQGIPSGIYYIYLESEGANTAKKIIVE